MLGASLRHLRAIWTACATGLGLTVLLGGLFGGCLPDVADKTLADLGPTDIYITWTGGTSPALVYRLDGVSGTLSYLDVLSLSGMVSASDTTPHPSGRFLYTCISGSGQVGRAPISVGAPNAPAAVAASTSYLFPAQILMHPSGNYLYALNSDSSANSRVDGFAVDQASGALTPINSQPLAFGGGMFGVMHPSGTYLLYGNNSTTLQTVPISGSGVLGTAVSTGVAISVTALAIDAAGSYLYAANGSGNQIAQFSLPGGVPTPVGSPAVVANGPIAIAVDPKNRFLYGVYWSGTTGPANVIQAYGIGSGGVINPSPMNTSISDGPVELQVHPTGRYLFAATLSTNLTYAFFVETNGSLTPVPGAPIDANISFLYGAGSGELGRIGVIQY